MRVDRTSDSKLPGLVVFLTLGVGLTLLFFGVDWFWVVFVLGFAVVLPMVGMVTGDEAEQAAAEDKQANDPLETLRDRYARGEIDEAEFERRVETLLDTESPEASDRMMTSRDEGQHREREAATDRS